jgi:lipoprotein-anchoring transpeptidase ErfK/SrfK
VIKKFNEPSTLVKYRTSYAPGTIVLDPHARFLYLVMENEKAMRYCDGVAKAGLEFTGEAEIERKAQCPGWAPTQDMIKRESDRYGPLADGLPGGIANPLGARALYLYQDGKDTLYRIHGTNESWSIGQSVSSGRMRWLNQDIIDLHSRVPKGSRVVVLGP